MSNDHSNTHRLVFPEHYRGQFEEETTAKGWLSGVEVLVSGVAFSLVFVDIPRLQQMLADEVAAGSNHYAEPGLVVVTEVTRANIRAAVDALAHEGFFERVFRVVNDP